MSKPKFPKKQAITQVEDMSFGACYQGNCQCLRFSEINARRCQCGHERSFHAPNSLAAWKRLEYPAGRLKHAADATSLSTLTSALGSTSLSTHFPGPSFLIQHFNNNNSPSNIAPEATHPFCKKSNIPTKNHSAKVKDVLQFLYEEGHFQQLLHETPPALSSLHDLVMGRFYPSAANSNCRHEIQAALELIDALWYPEEKEHAIHRSFATDIFASMCFRALDRMVLRAIRVLTPTGRHLGKNDSTLLTVGTVVLAGDNQQLVRSKMPNWGAGRASNHNSEDSLRNFILEQEKGLRQQVDPRAILRGHF